MRRARNHIREGEPHGPGRVSHLSILKQPPMDLDILSHDRAAACWRLQDCRSCIRSSHGCRTALIISSPKGSALTIRARWLVSVVQRVRSNHRSPGTHHTSPSLSLAKRAFRAPHQGPGMRLLDDDAAERDRHRLRHRLCPRVPRWRRHGSASLQSGFWHRDLERMGSRCQGGRKSG